MYEEEIEKLNKWFESKDRYWDTYHSGEEYGVCLNEVDDFCDFLGEMNPELIGISCMVGTDGIWFKLEDLFKARYL